MKKKINLLLTILILSLLYSIPALSQPSLPTPPGSAPIDGGLSLLVAAGVGYGAKKIREKKQRENKRKDTIN